MKQLAFDPVTVLSRLENLRDSVTDEKKPPWPGDFVVSPVAALSIVPMGVTAPCESNGAPSLISGSAPAGYSPTAAMLESYTHAPVNLRFH